LRGNIGGVVNDPDGKGIPGVRVIVDDTTETRSDAQGRFLMSGVRTGTRQVDFASIGMTPMSQVVDVTARDTVFANATLRTVTNLEAVKITASRSRLGSAMRFDERRKQGLGQYADSSTIGQRATLQAVFSGFAGVNPQAASANGRRSISGCRLRGPAPVSRYSRLTAFSSMTTRFSARCTRVKSQPSRCIRDAPTCLPNSRAP
jgi:hypothetical protein